MILEPIQINVSKTAKISDLIGLACFKYTIENREPKLRFLKKHYKNFTILL